MTDPLPTPDSAAPDAAARLLAQVDALLRETFPNREARAVLDSDFERDLGLDSLARVELMLRVQQAFAARLPDSALAEAATPRALLAMLGAAPAVGAGSAVTALALPEGSGEAAPDSAATLVEVIDWHARRHPQRTHVLLYGEGDAAQPISYGALREAGLRIAAGLLARGVRPQQAVALMLPTGREYLACFAGVLMAGAIPVPIYPPARLAQVEEHLRRHARILANAQAVMLITVAAAKAVALLLREGTPGLREVVTPEELDAPPVAIGHRAKPEDIAFLQYTSGSTGDPKGVTLTHANLLANIRAMAQAAQIGPDDVFVSWLPLYHDMGLIGAWMGSLYCAMPLVLMSPLAFLARPGRWLRALGAHRGTVSAAPNFAYDLIARKLPDAELEGLDLSAWRLALNGAEPVVPATLDAFAARLAPHGLKREALMPVYGLAECSVGLAFPPLGRGPRYDCVSRSRLAAEGAALPVAREDADAQLVVACGRAIPGHAMRVVDDGGVELPPRRVGRVQFRGPSATQGYYRNPEATARLVAGEWRDSGDYGYLVDGEIHLTGRAKDVIIRGGRNLYPYDLEQAVGGIEGVRRGCVAVFGVPDAATGSEKLVVLAETRETAPQARAGIEALIQDAAVAVFGLPAEEVALAPPGTVLKTSSGKIRRAACRELYLRGIPAQGARLPGWRLKARLVLPVAQARLRDAMRAGGLWLYGLWMWAMFLLCGLPVAAAVVLSGRPALAHRVIYHGARLFWRLAGVHIEARVSGLPGRAHVLVANHGSYLDTIFTVAVLPPGVRYAYVAKSEFRGHRFFRRFFDAIGALYVERFDARRGADDVGQIVAALRAGRSVVVFPEGTFSPESGVRPLRMGAFVAAARAGVPLATAGIRGARDMLRDRSWWPRPGRLELRLGAVLAPGGDSWADAVRLREAARAEIVALCGEPDLGV